MSTPSSSSCSSPARKNDGIQQLTTQILATHDLCKQRLLQQEKFEELVSQQLGDIQTNLSDLLVQSQAPPTNTQLPVPHSVPTVNTHMCTPTHIDHVPEKRMTLPTTPCEPPIQCVSTPSSSTSAPPNQPEQPEGEFGLAMRRILAVRNSSCSRENFASNVVKELFAKEERMKSNVKGMFGKAKFDERKIEYVRLKTFELFPLGATENMKKS